MSAIQPCDAPGSVAFLLSTPAPSRTLRFAVPSTTVMRSWRAISCFSAPGLSGVAEFSLAPAAPPPCTCATHPLMACGREPPTYAWRITPPPLRASTSLRARITLFFIQLVDHISATHCFKILHRCPSHDRLQRVKLSRAHASNTCKKATALGELQERRRDSLKAQANGYGQFANAIASACE